jgi:hypothetical protein
VTKFKVSVLIPSRTSRLARVSRPPAPPGLGSSVLRQSVALPLHRRLSGYAT